MPPPPPTPPDTEPDEGLEWVALLREYGLDLDIVGRRVRYWQEPPRVLTYELASLHRAAVTITNRALIRLTGEERHLGAYRVVLYLIPRVALVAPPAPLPWALKEEPEPGGHRWVRETVRHGESDVALEARWRLTGTERLSIVGLTTTTPKRLINQAWAGLPLMRHYQGISQTEEAFRAQVRAGLQELAQRRSNFERRLNVTRLARASGYSRGHFTTCLTVYGIDREALLSWRPGQPLPL